MIKIVENAWFEGGSLLVKQICLYDSGANEIRMTDFNQSNDGCTDNSYFWYKLFSIRTWILRAEVKTFSGASEYNRSKCSSPSSRTWIRPRCWTVQSLDDQDSKLSSVRFPASVGGLYEDSLEAAKRTLMLLTCHRPVTLSRERREIAPPSYGQKEDWHHEKI